VDEEMDLTEDYSSYENYLRMSEQRFITCLKNQSVIKKQDTLMRASLPPEVEQQVVLRYLMTGDCFEILAYLCEVPKCKKKNCIDDKNIKR